jgi:autotransporter-associated beta strand protein
MNTSMKIRLALAAVVLSILNLPLPIAGATLRIWSGNALASNAWTNGPNWSLNVAPVPGDDLQFPNGASKSNSNDNYTNGMMFNSIQFSHTGAGNQTFILTGNSIALNAGVGAVNDANSVWPNGFNNAFLLNSNQTFATGPYTSLTFNGPINLNGNSLTFDTAKSVVTDSPIDVHAVISGVGNLIKTNAGTLTLWSNNTYAGSTTLNAGTLAINGLQPNSPIVLNAGTLTGRGTVGTITSTGSGGPGSIVLNPSGTTSVLNCSNVSLNASTTYAAVLSGASTGIYNELNVHGTVALNNATLSVSLGFTPSIGEVFIIIANDGADPVIGTFNGLPEGSSFTIGNTQFTISYAGFDGNDVVLTVTRTTLTWSGGGTNTYWTNPANWTANVAPSPGSDLVFPLGAALLSASNNFPAGTLFNSITISGTNYSLFGSNILLNAGLNATNTTAQNYCYIPLTLNADQAITTGNAGVNLYLFGDIDLSNRNLTIAGDGNTQLSAMLHGSGGLVKSGNGIALLSGSNTFSGPVQILQGQIYLYHGHELGDTSGITTVANGGTLTLLNSMTVAETLALSGTLFGSDAQEFWTGPVTLTDPGATIIAASGGTLAINAPISGTNGFTKTGAGILLLNSNNTYTGTTAMNGGTLFINGSQPASPILLSGGNLYGTGTVGTITVSTPTVKTLWPGPGAGILNASNVSMDFSTLFNIELDGPAAGSGYGQLNVHGSVSLNNATLSVLVGGAFTPAVGESFTIINNDGQDPVGGIFNGLPEGATFTVGSALFSILYDGGDGNDVVIYRGNPPSRLTGVTTLSNRVAQVQGVGISNLTYTIQAATNLKPTINWSNLGTASANSNGTFSFTDTNAPLFPMRFYRVISP